VAIRLKTTPEFAHLAPTVEIIVGIIALFQGDNLGKLTKQQRKCPFGTDYTDSHIMLVQHKDITVQAGFMLGSNHNSKLPNHCLNRYLELTYLNSKKFHKLQVKKIKSQRRIGCLWQKNLNNPQRIMELQTLR